MTPGAKANAAGSASLAMTLAGVAGFVDAVGATLLGGLFVSFMSGNTTTAGLSLGQGGWARALHAGLPVPLYVLGAVCGTLLLGQAGRRARPLAFLVTALFLSLFGLLAHASTEAEWKQGPVATSLLVFPMGVMNATLRSVGRASVGLTDLHHGVPVVLRGDPRRVPGRTGGARRPQETAALRRPVAQLLPRRRAGRPGSASLVRPGGCDAGPSAPGPGRGDPAGGAVGQRALKFSRGPRC